MPDQTYIAPTAGSQFRARHAITLEHIDVHVPTGSIGVVTDTSNDTVSIKMADSIPGLVEWENKLIYTDDSYHNIFAREFEPVA